MSDGAVGAAETAPEDGVDGDDLGFIIVSLDVFSTAPIAELSAFERVDPNSDGERRYELGKISFEEEDATTRAQMLESTVLTLLDLLREVPRTALFDSGTFVRLFLTLGRGAQTLSSALVQKLAAVNATVWIDS